MLAEYAGARRQGAAAGPAEEVVAELPGALLGQRHRPVGRAGLGEQGAGGHPPALPGGFLAQGQLAPVHVEVGLAQVEGRRRPGAAGTSSRRSSARAGCRGGGCPLRSGRSGPPPAGPDRGRGTRRRRSTGTGSGRARGSRRSRLRWSGARSSATRTGATRPRAHHAGIHTTCRPRRRAAPGLFRRWRRYPDLWPRRWTGAPCGLRWPRGRTRVRASGRPLRTASRSLVMPSGFSSQDRAAGFQDASCASTPGSAPGTATATADPARVLLVAEEPLLLELLNHQEPAATVLEPVAGRVQAGLDLPGNPALRVPEIEGRGHLRGPPHRQGHADLPGARSPVVHLHREEVAGRGEEAAHPHPAAGDGALGVVQGEVLAEGIPGRERLTAHLHLETGAAAAVVCGGCGASRRGCGRRRRGRAGSGGSAPSPASSRPWSPSCRCRSGFRRSTPPRGCGTRGRRARPGRGSRLRSARTCGFFHRRGIRADWGDSAARRGPGTPALQSDQFAARAGAVLKKQIST